MTDWGLGFQHLLEQQEENGEQPKPEPKAHITQPELLRLLAPVALKSPDFPRVEEITKNEEIENTLRAGFSMDQELLVRAGWVMSERKVHDWLKSPNSCGLLINSNSTVERITPTSFFCAMLAKSIKAIKPILVLNHFCGLNTAEGDDEGWGISGGEGLLRSLTSQLIAHWRFGELTCLSLQEVEELKQTGSGPSFRVLRHVFRKLVTAVPATSPIFIIVDGINYYETSKLYKGTKQAVKEISRLLGDPEVKALVKVIVTSASRAFEVDEYFLDSEKVWVPDMVSGDKMGFVDMHFNSELARELGQLKRNNRGAVKPD